MRELEVAQAEQLQRIGTMLREEREKQRMPLEEIAVKTYIPLRLLQALEAGQIERLPEPVFIQGFIRRYADAIGLDGPAISKQFAFDPSPVPAQPNLAAEVSAGTTATPVLPAPEPERASIASVASALSARQRSLIVAGGLGALVMAIAAIALLNAPKQSTPPANTSMSIANPLPAAPKSPNPPAPPPAQSTPPSPAPSPVPAPQASPAPSPTAAQATQPTNGPVMVTVNVTEEAWVWVDADGQTVFEGTLNKGDKRTWNAKQSLTLGSGNAGGITYSLNQGAAKTLGAAGVTQEVTFPPRSAN